MAGIAFFSSLVGSNYYNTTVVVAQQYVLLYLYVTTTASLASSCDQLQVHATAAQAKSAQYSTGPCSGLFTAEHHRVHTGAMHEIGILDGTCRCSAKP